MISVVHSNVSAFWKHRKVLGSIRGQKSIDECRQIKLWLNYEMRGFAPLLNFLRIFSCRGGGHFFSEELRPQRDLTLALPSRGNSSCFACYHWKFSYLTPTPLNVLLCGHKGRMKRRLQHTNWQASNRTFSSLPLKAEVAFNNTETERPKVCSDQNLELMYKEKL